MRNNAPILIDVTRMIWRRWTGRRPTGIDRVCLAYLEHFAPQAQAVVQAPHFPRILDRKASDALFDLLLGGGEGFRSRFIRLASKFGWLSIWPLRGNGRTYLNVGHTGLDRLEFTHWIRRINVRPIYMVHDLIPITHPEYCRAGEATKHGLRIKTMLETGSAIIGNSQATLDALDAFADSEALPRLPQISAWLGGTSLRSKPCIGNAPEKPYFVVLGTIEARKNHIMLLNLWSELIRELGHSTPQLRIIGQRGWEADHIFTLLDHNALLKGHVIEINDCTDMELSNHLSHACALLFPSMVEGYGLPLIEAMGAGIPVLASNIPVFREIAGDIPVYLDPADIHCWKEAICNYMAPDSTSRAGQLEKLTQYSMPDWQTHFSAIDEWLDYQNPTMPRDSADRLQPFIA